MTARATVPESERIRVNAPGAHRTLALGELWDARELVQFLVWRDVKVRYRQTLLGAAWAVLQPTAMMIVFTIFFGRLGRMPSDGSPFPLFAYVGLLPWQLFSSALTGVANGLVVHERLLTKVAFPRLVIPVATALVPLIDFLIALAVLAVLLVWYGVVPGIAALAIPALALLAVAAALAIGLWLSVVNVLYRDVRYVLPFLVQFGLFVTPVAYPSSLVAERWRLLYELNPMVGVIDGFRWALLGSGSAPGRSLVMSVAVVLVLLLSGVRFFRRHETTFADVI